MATKSQRIYYKLFLITEPSSLSGLKQATVLPHKYLTSCDTYDILAKTLANTSVNKNMLYMNIWRIKTMAILKTEDGQVEVTNGAEVVDAAEELGVSFGCGNGVCGACEVEVEDGMQHLNELTEAEEDMGLDDGHRLMCQCVIKGGTVKISI
jgi:ferredoxin, 2Fe-2S